MGSSAPFPIINGQYKMSREPIVRIGVILEEDGKSGVTLALQGAGYQLTSPGWPPREIAGDRDSLYRIRVTSDGGLSIESPNGITLASNVVTFRIVPPATDAPVQPGDGILVKDIVAGRGFHWAKLIDQTLSHTLEFQSRNGHIIMINELPIETYLIGVITGEMSNECPIEFMKAQAVAARSWLLGQPVPPHPDEPFLWCNDDHCQRYQGTGGWNDLAIRAIAECRGEVLITPTNQYCDARYSKSTGGISEDATAVWGVPIEGLEALPDAPKGDAVERFFPITEENFDEYLDGAWLGSTGCFASPNVVPEETITRYLGRVDEVGEYFRWTVEFTQEQLVESLRQRAGINDLAVVEDLIHGHRGRSGRLESLTVVYTATDGSRRERLIEREYNIRAGLSKKFLYSGAIRITPIRSGAGRLEKIVVRGAGWGHGAGLCQIGALGRALKGQDYATILLHYYSGVRLESIYP
jgi:SpoIID/LytB domain protein